jgi:hypothetical protein
VPHIKTLKTCFSKKLETEDSNPDKKPLMNKPFPIRRPFADALFDWGRRLAERRLMGSHGDKLRGSLSYRFGLGFVMTSSQAPIERLSDCDLQFIQTMSPQDGRAGTQAESALTEIQLCHALTYRSRGGVIFVFHAIDPRLEKAALEKGAPFLDAKLSDKRDDFRMKFEEQLGKGNLVVLKGRGVISLGCTADDTGEQILGLLPNRKKA